MTGPYVAGFDLSTTAVHCAAVPLEQPVILGQSIHLTMAPISSTTKRRQELSQNPAERAAVAGRAARVCVETLHARGIEVVFAAIERPAGRGIDKLLPILGAITSAVDELHPSWWLPAQWRKEIGCVGRAVNTKEGGYARVLGLTLSDIWPTEVPGEHFADAIGVGLAMRSFLLRNEDAGAA